MSTNYYAIQRALQHSPANGVEPVALVTKYEGRLFELEPTDGGQWTARCSIYNVEGCGGEPEAALRACLEASRECELNTEVSISGDAGGTYVEWFNEANYDVPMVARWYGNHAACVERAKLPPPQLYPWRSSERGTDAATATGMYDR